VTLTNVTFSGNTATNNGGGMYNQVGSNSAMTNVTFSANAADKGGAIYNSGSSPTMKNVTFNDNSATDHGGGMYIADYSYPEFHNTIFWGNTAAGGIGAQIYNYSGNTTSSDSIVQGGCADTSWSCGTNIITADPKLGALGYNGGFTKTIPLLVGSSAIDTGNDTFCPATDQRGVARPQGAHCDIGAYELDTTAPMVTSITRFNPNPTNLANVDFTVTFSEAVTGVDASDFSLSTTGISGATITAISLGPIIYAVTVNTGHGNGTIRLDVPSSATITDLALNLPAGLPYTGGETYTISKEISIFLPIILR